MAEGDFSHSYTLTTAEAAALIDKTRFAISTEETRYYLNGIYLHVAGEKDKVLRTVATDGHRLARIEVALPAGADGQPGVIIPRKTIAELKNCSKAKSAKCRFPSPRAKSASSAAMRCWCRNSSTARSPIMTA